MHARRHLISRSFKYRWLNTKSGRKKVSWWCHLTKADIQSWKSSDRSPRNSWATKLKWLKRRCFFLVQEGRIELEQALVCFFFFFLPGFIAVSLDLCLLWKGLLLEGASIEKSRYLACGTRFQSDNQQILEIIPPTTMMMMMSIPTNKQESMTSQLPKDLPKICRSIPGSPPNESKLCVSFCF